MLALTHTLVSLPFGVYLENPLLIFSSAFVWHLVCDTFLHWNIYPDNFKKFPTLLIALDVGGGILIAWLITGPSFFTVPILVAILGGNMPDIVQGIWEVLLTEKQRQRLSRINLFFRFHYDLQYETTNVANGLLAQIILIATSLVLL